MTGPALARALEQMVVANDLVVPPYPAAALRLQRLLSSGMFGMGEVAEAVSSDPVLAATLLRVANSAAYRPEGATITTLGRAVNRLGARAVAGLAVTTGVGASACAPGPLVDLRYRVWRRSLVAALLCQKLAPSRKLDPEEAFLAGLLHGFGRSVGAACLERVLAASPPTALPFDEWLEIIEQQREALARGLCQHWQLPEEISAAISPEAAQPGAAPLFNLVRFVEPLAQSIDNGQEPDAALLGPIERGLVSELIRSLPATLDALVQAPQGRPARPPPPSAIAKPDTVLHGQVRPAQIPVSSRSRGGAELRAVGVAPDGLRLSSPSPMQEGVVTQLTVGEAAHSFEGWFNVALCVAGEGGYRIEVQLFSANRELLTRFTAFVAAAGSGR